MKNFISKTFLLFLTFQGQSVLHASAGRSPAATKKARKPASLSALQKVDELTNSLMELIKIYLAEKDAAFKNPNFKEALVKVGVALQESGHLESGLDLATKKMVAEGIIPKEKMDEATRKFLVATIAGAVKAELQQRGLIRDGAGRSYETWQNLNIRISAELDILPKDSQNLSNNKFWKFFEAQAQTNFMSGNKVELLIDGPMSFEQRDTLLNNAKKEILIISWAIEDDSTGDWLRERLLKIIEKQNNGIKIKIIVDGQTAKREGYHLVLDSLEKSGIEVVRWINSEKIRSADGQHRKMLIVDGAKMVAGGLNWGDHYSHLAKDTVKSWRDTDLSVEGPAVFKARELFRSLWNEKAMSDNTLTKLEKTPIPKKVGKTRLAVVNHQPGNGENILRSIILAIKGAKKVIYIQNAYFILDPVVAAALADARSRGVRIVVMTNSDQSVDEAVVIRPILKSVNRLLGMGVEVYLKKGKDETLHSKAMMVDGIYSWVGSQNFHPRSLRYEGEVIFAVKDKLFASKMQEMFENDLSMFEHLSEAIKIEENALADLQEELFFDQL